jgi:hypothetical protein
VTLVDQLGQVSVYRSDSSSYAAPNHLSTYLQLGQSVVGKAPRNGPSRRSPLTRKTKPAVKEQLRAKTTTGICLRVNTC